MCSSSPSPATPAPGAAPSPDASDHCATPFTLTPPPCAAHSPLAPLPFVAPSPAAPAPCASPSPATPAPGANPSLDAAAPAPSVLLHLPELWAVVCSSLGLAGRCCRRRGTGLAAAEGWPAGGAQIYNNYWQNIQIFF